MHRLCSLIIYLFIFLTFLPAAANDTLVTLGAGGLVPIKSTEIVMESEDLNVSVHQINVNYVFRNISSHDVDAVVAFPLPTLDGGTIENEPMRFPSKDPVNFLSFAVTVDGHAIWPTVELRAFKDGKDITARLVSLGLPVSVLDPQLRGAIGRLTSEQSKQLEAENLVIDEEYQKGADGTPQHETWAWWETRVQFYWSQHFPANGTVSISHRYQPIVGGSYIVRSDEGIDVKPYCGGAEALTQIHDLKTKLGKKGDDVIGLWERRVQYILTTGNNWSGPIRSFRLQIVKDNPDEILATCLPNLSKVSDTIYELTRTNFHPDSELNVLILEPNK
jgi:hypothetical protein